jgi:hypothetical protein
MPSRVKKSPQKLKRMEEIYSILLLENRKMDLDI